MPAVRERVATLSRPALQWLHRQPRWLLGGVVAVLVIAGLAAPRPVGPICLGIVTVLLCWLAYLSWPDGDTNRRVVRILMVLLCLGAFALRLFS